MKELSFEQMERVGGEIVMWQLKSFLAFGQVGSAMRLVRQALELVFQQVYWQQELSLVYVILRSSQSAKNGVCWKRLVYRANAYIILCGSLCLFLETQCNNYCTKDHEGDPKNRGAAILNYIIIIMTVYHVNTNHKFFKCVCPGPEYPFILLNGLNF